MILDNRRMAAISGLQMAQCGRWGPPSLDHGGDDPTTLRTALAQASAHDGISVVHVPIYCGDDPRGGLGAYGQWNVGNWVEDVQARYRDQDL